MLPRESTEHWLILVQSAITNPVPPSSMKSEPPFAFFVQSSFVRQSLLIERDRNQWLGSGCGCFVMTLFVQVNVAISTSYHPPPDLVLIYCAFITKD